MAGEHRQQYRDILIELRRRISGEARQVVESIQEDANPTGNLSNAPVHLADAADDIIADVTVLATEHDMLREIDAALARLNDGTFGQCVQCGQKISEERLRAIPFAPRCIHCARQVE
ncbi:MAG TPA: TraR/DksA family transcriptional regulator [Pirellulaceae bacterium]|nr:TraR/DksA family transcriptional regulator [Pirellulaceae bacterium]